MRLIKRNNQSKNAATPYRYEQGTLFGILPVEKQFQYRGIGRLLIYKAMDWECVFPIGVKILLVGAKNNKVKDIYKSLIFTSFDLNDSLYSCFNLKNFKQ